MNASVDPPSVENDERALELSRPNELNVIPNSEEYVDNIRFAGVDRQALMLESSCPVEELTMIAVNELVVEIQLTAILDIVEFNELIIYVVPVLYSEDTRDDVYAMVDGITVLSVDQQRELTYSVKNAWLTDKFCTTVL